MNEAGLLVSARSRLRGKMLDALHDAGIEIVSPSFMNQRPLPPELKFIPKRKKASQPEEDKNGHAEEILFSKAEVASAVENIEGKIKKLKEKLKTEAEEGEEDIDREAIKAELATLTEELETARENAKEESARDRNGKADSDEGNDTAK